jgi:hypothetical protein
LDAATDFDVLHYNTDLGYGPVNWADKNAIIEVHKCQRGYLKHLPSVLCSQCSRAVTFRVTIHEYEARNEALRKCIRSENMLSKFSFSEDERNFESQMDLGRS